MSLAKPKEISKNTLDVYESQINDLENQLLLKDKEIHELKLQLKDNNNKPKPSVKIQLGDDEDEDGNVEIVVLNQHCDEDSDDPVPDSTNHNGD